jgi:hypothetical protein
MARRGGGKRKKVSARATPESLKNMRKAIKEAQISVTDPLDLAVHEEAQFILSKSVRLAPVDTGALRQSAQVRRTEGATKTSRKLIGYRMGYGTTYALAVHEKHKTKSKFLEQPFNEVKANYSQRIQKRMEKWIKRFEGWIV